MGANHLPDWARLIKVFSQAVDRMKAGSADYGEYDPRTDTRDMYHEAQEEILDAIVYLGMEYMRLDDLRHRWGFPNSR